MTITLKDLCTVTCYTKERCIILTRDEHHQRIMTHIAESVATSVIHSIIYTCEITTNILCQLTNLYISDYLRAPK